MPRRTYQILLPEPPKPRRGTVPCQSFESFLFFDHPGVVRVSQWSIAVRVVVLVVMAGHVGHAETVAKVEGRGWSVLRRWWRQRSRGWSGVGERRMPYGQVGGGRRFSKGRGGRGRRHEGMVLHQLLLLLLLMLLIEFAQFGAGSQRWVVRLVLLLLVVLVQGGQTGAVGQGWRRSNGGCRRYGRWSDSRCRRPRRRLWRDDHRRRRWFERCWSWGCGGCGSRGEAVRRRRDGSRNRGVAGRDGLLVLLLSVSLLLLLQLLLLQQLLLLLLLSMLLLLSLLLILRLLLLHLLHLLLLHLLLWNQNLLLLLLHLNLLLLNLLLLRLLHLLLLLLLRLLGSQSGSSFGTPPIRFLQGFGVIFGRVGEIEILQRWERTDECTHRRSSSSSSGGGGGSSSRRRRRRQ